MKRQKMRGVYVHDCENEKCHGELVFTPYVGYRYTCNDIEFVFGEARCTYCHTITPFSLTKRQYERMRGNANV